MGLINPGLPRELHLGNVPGKTQLLCNDLQLVIHLLVRLGWKHQTIPGWDILVLLVQLSTVLVQEDGQTVMGLLTHKGEGSGVVIIIAPLPVFLEAVALPQPCLDLRVLMGEIFLPPRAEIDVPPPEPPDQRLGVPVISCKIVRILDYNCCYEKIDITCGLANYYSHDPLEGSDPG